MARRRYGSSSAPQRVNESSAIEVASVGTRLEVKSPYNKRFVDEVKQLGGQWDRRGRTWSVPVDTRDELEKLLGSVYGWNKPSAPTPTPAPAPPAPAPQPVVTTSDEQREAGARVEARRESRRRAEDDEETLATKGVARWNDNITALRTIKKLESENREATAAERRTLEGYSGFGGSEFNPAFGTRGEVSPAWQRRSQELQELTTEDEWNAISGSRLNAFYTTPEVIGAMWGGLDRLGASKAEGTLRVLEPSAGTGRFLDHMPRNLRAEATAVELDDLTSRILRAKHPEATVHHSGFEKAPVPDDHYDIAISNVPFGGYGVVDAEKPKFLTARIHNYFFDKALDKVRPGGVVAFISSRGTMDSQEGERVREHLAERADLLGAVRLPRGAFPDTKVVTDIIYLRKRAEGEEPGDSTWVTTDEITVPHENGYRTNTVPVNRYYTQNPEQVLGKHSVGRGLRDQDEYIVVSEDFSPSQADTALGRSLSDDAATLAVRPERRARPIVAQPSAPRLKAGDRERVAALGSVHDAARDLLTMEAETVGDDPRIDALRSKLSGEYDAYRKEYGTDQ